MFVNWKSHFLIKKFIYEIDITYTFNCSDGAYFTVGTVFFFQEYDKQLSGYQILDKHKMINGRNSIWQDI